MNDLFQAIHSVDLNIYHFLTGFAGNWVLDRFASHEEANNLFKGGIFLAMYWYLWFRIGPDRETSRRAIIAIFVGALLALIVARTIAFIAPFRLRPIYDATLGHPAYSIPWSANLEDWSAFPSDAATYFFALAFGLAYLLRRFTIPILLYTMGWICLPRIYLGVHYASDILVGAAIGVTTVWLSLRAELLQSTVAHRVLATIEMRPQRFYAIAFLVSFEMATMFDDIRHAARALFHAASVGSYYGFTHSGLLVFVSAVFIAGATYIAFLLSRKHRCQVGSVQRQLELPLGDK